MTSEVEAVLSRVLPWIGGFTGATLLYFGVMVWLAWQQGKRLAWIERELSVQHGILLGLLRGKRRE